MKKIPVFFINGMLDSGKSTFIIDTLNNDQPEDGNLMKTLLVCCEQGEVEYTSELLKKTNTEIIYFENESDFDYKVLDKEIKKVKPDRVVIEMNGMWELTKLQFPRNIEIVQVVSFIDASTFGVYFNNMRQKFNDMISRSQIVCFTKLTSKDQIEPYQTALKLINNRCAYYIFDELLRASDAFEEPLPYDVEAPLIKIEEKDYPTFYVDTFDHKERYEGKEVEYDAMVFLTDKLPENQFIAGRMIMNCCANDVQLYGFIASDNLGVELKNKCWIHIKAKISYEFSEEYNEEELILNPISITLIDGKDKEEVLNMTA